MGILVSGLYKKNLSKIMIKYSVGKSIANLKKVNIKTSLDF